MTCQNRRRPLLSLSPFSSFLPFVRFLPHRGFRRMVDSNWSRHLSLDRCALFPFNVVQFGLNCLKPIARSIIISYWEHHQSRTSNMSMSFSHVSISLLLDCHFRLVFALFVRWFGVNIESLLSLALIENYCHYYYYIVIIVNHLWLKKKRKRFIPPCLYADRLWSEPVN